MSKGMDGNQEVEDRIRRTIVFLNAYKQITNAYVSDYFVHNHQQLIKESWRTALKDLAPIDLVTLLVNSDIKQRTVWPLSLMAFVRCSHALSLVRHPSKVKAGCSLKGVNLDELLDNASSPSIADGQMSGLDHSFRKHVKPKKQHEIQQLAKVISCVSQASQASHVVDVGAGLGHLSRLLSFGYNLRVTTVEAADGHAPRAAKFDHEIQRDIQKGKLLPSAEFNNPVLSPEHVTLTLHPDVTISEFLRVIQSSSDQHFGLNRVVTGCDNSVQCKSLRNTTGLSNSSDNQPLIAGPCPESNDRTDSQPDCVKSNCSTSCCLPAGYPKMSDSAPLNSNCDNTSASSRGHASESFENISDICRERNTELNTNTAVSLCVCTTGKLHHDNSFRQSSSSGLFTEGNNELEPPSDFCAHLSKKQQLYGSNCLFRTGNKKQTFVMAGLHACGDLTPTLLRLFAECPLAVGLVSVPCCYMKLTCQSNGAERSYPLSQFSRSCEGHELSWEAREMACHSVDMYTQKLKNNDPSLKSHCYRAALQVVLSKSFPTMEKGTVKVSVKNCHQMSFEEYALKSLKKLGLPSEGIDFLKDGESLLSRWREVVTFYVLRLSLAPVVESLILLDRLLFLREKGIHSCLVPVFDPSLSPRNIALLATKR